ncbi:hypothetical protein KC960_01495 [Candidatus Saccharibacteria bacterium]|nr:hypothetical protein [Candidatus Saccharibacteria bacterium]
MAEKKIIDIAGPEDSKLNIGGKPMIIGHKSIASDPMVKSDSNEQPAVSESTEKDDAPQDVKVMSSSDKIKIEPPKSEEKPVDKTETKEEVVEAEPKTDDDSKASKDDKAPAEEKSDKSDDQASESTKVENEKSEDSKVTAEKETKSDDEKKEKSGEIDPVAAAMEKDQKIQELIKSKKYFVDIKKPARGSSGKKLITFIVLLVVLFMGLYLLIDSGKLDIGVKLPYNFFNNSEKNSVQEPATNSQPVESNNTEQDKPAESVIVNAEIPKGFVLFDGSKYGFTFSYPEEFGTVELAEDNDTGIVFFNFANNTQYGFSVTEKGRTGPSGHDSPTLNLQNFVYDKKNDKYSLVYVDPDATTTNLEDANKLFASDSEGNSYLIYEGAGISYFVAGIAKVNSDKYESVVFSYSPTVVRETAYTAEDEGAIQLKHILDTFRTVITQ